MSDAPYDQTRWKRLLRRVGRIASQPSDAEDYLHSAFVRLEEYRANNLVTNPDSFLVRTATNLAIDESRRPANRMDQASVETLELSDHQPLQDEVLAARERLERVRCGIARLAPRTREAFLLNRLEGLKYREVAARMGITVSAVEKHIAKAAFLLAEWDTQ